MIYTKLHFHFLAAILFFVCNFPSIASPAEQTVAIFHAFNQYYSEVEQFVCDLAEQGYSHVQADAPYIKHGVKFRQIMRQRGAAGGNVKENVLAAVDSPTVLLMEQGNEELCVVNKGTDKFDVAVLDLTLTNLEGCYRELRNNFSVAVEQRSGGKKFVTRWGAWDRGGMEVHGRDALCFIREPWEQCQAS